MVSADAITFPGLVRHLINDALTDDEIRNLCFDHFRSVYDQLSPAMSRTECIRRLVQWCYENRQFGELLIHLKSQNATTYGEYAGRLAAIKEENRYPASTTTDSTALLPPCIVHPLPPAPNFVGRKRELTALSSFWNNAPPGAISLVGLGGAGKTAIAAQFLNNVLTGDQLRPAGLFVWSFYVNQDVNAFLESAYHYFSGGRSVHGSGAGMFYLLMESLNRRLSFLLVLDGLERVQRPQADKSGYFGELSDPLLAQLVVRLAAGLGSTKCVITTRFPLPTLSSWLGKTFEALDIDQLEVEDAYLLLRRHGIKGDDATLGELIEEYGAHALTLDHLGGYLSEYADGDPAQAKELPEPELDSVEPQERRLARVLHAYDNALSDKEHALLARLCVFRFGTTCERLHSVFATGDNAQITGPLKGLSAKDFDKILKHLLHLHLVLKGGDDEFTAHPAVRDHFYRAFSDPRIMHQAIRRHFSSLVGAPGTTLPEVPDTIDLLEELVYHTLQAGNIDEAREIYYLRLGTYQHLAWNLGHYSRCIRILTEFPRCPDRGGLIWCYRAAGDLTAAEVAVDPDDDWWLSMIECLRGHLHNVTEMLADSRQDPVRAVAEFLTGTGGLESLEQAPIWTGLPITPAECYLMASRVTEAQRFLARSLDKLERTVRGATWNDEIARLDLINAEIKRRNGNHTGCHALLEKATQWIVQSGSQEHLCILHLGKARLAIDEEALDVAKTALDEGLHVSEQCGFGYYSIQLHVELAEFFVRVKDYSNALIAGNAARNGILKSTREPADSPDVNSADLLVIGADHPKSRYVWGTSRAGFLQGKALAKLGKQAEAKFILDSILQLQKQIGDPDVTKTESFLASF